METVRMALSYPIEFRNNSTDKGSKMVNCYAEKSGETVYAVKRPAYTLANISLPEGTAQGLFSFQNTLISIIDNYFYVSDGTVNTLIGQLEGDVAPCYFAKTANDTYLFIHKKDKGYVFDGTDLTLLGDDYVAFTTVLTGGTGYTSPPSVTFGEQWQASTAYTLNQQIFYGANLYTVIIPGITSTSAPTFTSGTQVDGSATLKYAGKRATGTTTLTSGVVTDIVITFRGSGYISTPTVTIGGGGTSQAYGSCLLNAFPKDLVSGTAYFDGSVYVMTRQGRIYNSELENPKKWNALNYLTAEYDPDKAVALCKHMNYIVGLSERSIEFFYDNANPVGSPLLPNAPLLIEMGCASGDSVVQMEQTVVWVATGTYAGRMVLMLNGNRPDQISDVSIERILNSSSLENVTAYSLKVSGHYFYVLNLLDDDITLVYDLTTKVWTIWTSTVDGVERHIDGIYYASYNNLHYTIDKLDGNMYNISEDVFIDHSGPINFRVRTPLFDGNTTKRKFISRLEIVGDKVPTYLYARYTDDDYQSWSEARAINLGLDRSTIYQCGAARRRAYEFLNTDNFPLRLAYMEMDIDAGNT